MQILPRSLPQHKPAPEALTPEADAGGPWRLHAGDLALWAWERLVNRTDVWGAYLPLERRERTKSYTAPAKKHRGRVFLSTDTLAQHFKGGRVEDVIGLHSTSPENLSLWAALDIDAHDGGTADPARNLAAALHWHDTLTALGFRPLLTDSNGAGGYHLLALFARPIPTARVFHFLRWLCRDHAEAGLDTLPETFPKQPTVSAPGEPGQYGNWLRLPGRLALPGPRRGRARHPARNLPETTDGFCPRRARPVRQLVASARPAPQLRRDAEAARRSASPDRAKELRDRIEKLNRKIQTGQERLLSIDAEEVPGCQEIIRGWRLEKEGLEDALAVAEEGENAPQVRHQEEELRMAEAWLFKLRAALQSGEPPLVRSTLREMVSKVTLEFEHRARRDGMQCSLRRVYVSLKTERVRVAASPRGRC
jgi:hypothetical protein